jgi:parallel beta-helix repeat protein
MRMSALSRKKLAAASERRHGRQQHVRYSSYLAATAAVFITSHAYARNYGVGTCNTAIGYYTTIQEAVNSVPAGSVIKICPGTYPEQVTISKNITLEGVTAANSSYAAITIPAGGAVVNGSDVDGGGAVAAQILVTNAASVTIDDLTIDGSNNNITTCATDLVGILFQNASGTIKSNAVVNQIQPAGYTGCQGGLAIYVETGAGKTSTVTISGNQVANYQKNGITANDAGTSATISSNNVLGVGPTTGAAENSIQMAFGATGKINGNQVGDDIWAPDTFSDTGDAAAGILVYDSAGVTIASNLVTSTQFGIAVESDGSMSADHAAITNNRISATYLFDAIDVCGAGAATISTNVISGAAESGIHLDSSCGTPSTGNTLSGNSVNGSCAAVLEGTGSAGSVATLAAVNSLYTTLAGSDQCPLASASAIRPKAPKHRPSVSVFRPGT